MECRTHRGLRSRRCADGARGCPPASQTPDASVEAQGLAREVRIETVLEIAERANPEIREAQERARSVGRATQQDVLRAVVDLSHWRGASRVGYMEQP